jgi:hypothetical protein
MYESIYFKKNAEISTSLRFECTLGTSAHAVSAQRFETSPPVATTNNCPNRGADAQNTLSATVLACAKCP